MINFVLGRSADADGEHLSTFAKDLVHFANDTRDKVQAFSRKLDGVLGKERLVQGATKASDKVVDILNQFVMLSGQCQDLSTVSILVSNLGLFLLLLNVQVNVASLVIFSVFNESFRSCTKAQKLGSVAVSVGDCQRLLEAGFSRLENHVVEGAEAMYRIGGLVHSGDDVQGPFQRLRASIDGARLESAKADEKVAETLAIVKKILISPGRRKLIIQVATVLGGCVGFCSSMFVSWIFSWFVAVITILIGTTAFGILGAIVGFKIVNGKETSLLEELVKCTNQRDCLRKNFESFKYKMQNSDLYVKYANHDEVTGETGMQALFREGQEIPLNDFTEC